MSARRPEPGSPWAKHCPDAWPREWLDASGALPTGFTRAADPLEADLITGRMTEAAFLAVIGAPPVRAPAQRRDRTRKPNPVVAKVLGYRRFFDGLPGLAPRLSPGAVALWCWLWTCERKGRSRYSVRKLATRFGAGLTTIVNRLKELREAGFIRVVRRGRTGQTCTVVRIRATPKRQPDPA
ncbi:: HTH_36 [Gemmata massiliana]|uniref:: HTH_36 n=1 Tax=Gemmata massiliana TaxID=1210884 RepID=A0A6P2CWZ9_9BACT|nr:helix-turn-helix domain-containing protein [Gemmata massiliana]VTR91690.1 : HTH_36 [Gemmata massiliana]